MHLIRQLYTCNVHVADTITADARVVFVSLNLFTIDWICIFFFNLVFRIAFPLQIKKDLDFSIHKIQILLVLMLSLLSREFS